MEQRWRHEAILQSVNRTAAEMRPAVAAYYTARAPLYAEAIMEGLPVEAPAKWAGENLGLVVGGPEQANLIRDLYLEPAASYIRRGGKLIRPFLATLCLEAFGADPHRFKPIITLAEIIEVTSQILDDIADESHLRRGGLCAHIAHGTEHAYTSAMSLYEYFPWLIAPLGLPDEVTVRLYDMLTWEHYVTGIGTAVDLGWGVGMGEPSEDRWVLQTLGRSSSYTYRAPMVAAALAARAPEADLQALFQYAGKLGVAFQLMDDRFNLLAPAGDFGTVRGEDITGGKRTLLLIHALAHLAPTGRQRLEELVGRRTRETAEIDEAISLIESAGAFDHAREMAVRLVAEAREHVASLHVAPEFRTLFQDFAFYVTERRR